MKKTTVFLIMIFIFLLVLGSCTSISDLSFPGKKEAPQRILSGKSDFLTINSSYTLESLLVPVIQMNNFMMSIDYFDQFIEYNDYIFPDYLFQILGMETTSYKPGEGSVLYGKPENGSPPFTFEKALLSRDDLGNSWWQLNIEYKGKDLFIEVYSNQYDIPLKIRSIDPGSGFGFEIVPDIALDFDNAINEVPPEKLADSVQDKIERNISDGLSMNFANSEIIGEEIVETPAGKFMAVLVRNLYSDTEWANYWLSPDVPGGIVRISHTINGSEETNITELIELPDFVESKILDENLFSMVMGNYNDDIPVNMEPGFSEGSIDSPVIIYPYEEYFGSVSDEGISYYKFKNTKRADLFIEVYGLEGSAELVYFGNNSTFDNWTTSSEGNSLNIEDYMVLSGETVYFSVNDKVDEYSVGEHYTIYIDQNPILDPIGIMMKGDIFNSALELESGNSYSLTAGSEGLDYYKTTVKKGSTLIIEISNEPDFGSLIWFDTKNGSYSGMYSEWNQDSKTIKIEGLEPGTVCYYYFSSDTDLFDPLQKLELQITEK